MSRQINFYAAPDDTERIHQWLLDEFPGLTLISQRRGPRQHTIPIEATKPGAFWHYPVSLLVPNWAKDSLLVKDLGDRFPGEFIVSEQVNPVIEYAPCHWDEAAQIASSSRFYWAYPGDLPDEALQQINKLFRWVQRNTVTAERMSFRFFPMATKSARFVRQGLNGSLRENPLRSDGHSKPVSDSVGKQKAN